MTFDQCSSPLESVNSPAVQYLSFFMCLEGVRYYTDMDERRNVICFTVWSSWPQPPMESSVMIANWQHCTLKKEMTHCWVWVGVRRRRLWSGWGKGHTCHMLATFGAHPNRWSVSTSPDAHYPACFSTDFLLLKNVLTFSLCMSKVFCNRIKDCGNPPFFSVLATHCRTMPALTQFFGFSFHWWVLLEN